MTQDGLEVLFLIVDWDYYVDAMCHGRQYISRRADYLLMHEVSCRIRIADFAAALHH